MINKHTKGSTIWFRLIAGISIGSIFSLLLSWFIAPLIASFFASILGDLSKDTVPTSLLLIDLCLSTIFVFLGCLISIKVAKFKPYMAAFGVSLIGWIIYYREVGGLEGMIGSMYPLWYEFFPSNFGAGWVASALNKINKLSMEES